MRRIGVFVGAVLAVLVAAAATALYVGFSTELLTPLLEKQLSNSFGRAVRIGQGPTLRVRDVLTVTLGDVEVANAAWGDGTPLLHIEHLHLALVTRTIVRGPLTVERLELTGTDLNLQIDANGASNVPSLEDDTGESNDDGEPKDDAQRTPLVLDSAEIRRLRLRRRDARTGNSIDLFVDRLQQRSAQGTTLSVVGEGTLQERPWKLRLAGSPLRSLLSDAPINATIHGELDALRLDGEMALPAADRLRDVTANLTLAGSVPPEIAKLSPLLDADQPMRAKLVVDDIDPGISINLDVDFTSLDIAIEGQIDEPIAGDGLNVGVSVDAASLPRLAQALGLEPGADIPLAVSARIDRRGKRFSIDDINMSAGNHAVQGSILLPALPGSDNADIVLTANGPDFGFYQRLFGRAISLDSAYSIDATVTADPNGADKVRLTALLADIEVAVEGAIADFPSYRGSSLTFAASGPSLESLGKLVEQPSFPTQPFALNGAIDVSDAGVITLGSVRADAIGLTATLNGSVNGYPQFDQLNATLSLATPSIARSADAWGLTRLPGAVPLRLDVAASGGVNALSFRDFALSAGGLRAQSTTGQLQLTPDGLASDLRLTVAVRELATLLGEYAPSAMPQSTLDFELAPGLQDDLVIVEIDRIQGSGVTGSATVQLAPGLLRDDRTSLNSDLTIASPAELIPAFGPYTPPTQALAIRATTQRDQASGTPMLIAELRAENIVLMSASAQIGRANQGTHILLQGQGPDLQRLGAISGFKGTPLPYTIEAEATLDDHISSLSLKSFRLGGSEATGEASFDGQTQTLTANINVPKAEAGTWLTALQPEPAGASNEAAPASKDNRLIPAIPLPDFFFTRINSRIAITTGPLGLQDPVFADASLVDSLRLRVTTDASQASLAVDEALGSRGNTEGLLTLERDSDNVRVALTLDTVGLPLGITAKGFALETLPKHDVSVRLAGHGTTVRDVAATLSGDVFVTGTEGRVRNSAVNMATESFLAQTLTTVLPMVKTDASDVRIECAVLGIQAQQGVLALDPGFVLRTRRVDLSARGEIDLNDEALAIRFDNQARKGLGISAASLVNPYVQITGTLRRPSLGIDVASSALAGTAAVASGGLTVLAKPLYGRFLRRGSPCDTAAERWAKRESRANVD